MNQSPKTTEQMLAARRKAAYRSRKAGVEDASSSRLGADAMAQSCPQGNGVESPADLGAEAGLCLHHTLLLEHLLELRRGERLREVEALAQIAFQLEQLRELVG